ncbi:MAG: TRAP transporter substrate-binding protein DctP [Verrucomicrobiota bacterium]
MKRLLIVAVGLTLASGIFAADAPVKIKLGTLVPKDSSPHQSLKLMAEQWRQAPGGGVKLSLYTDGTLGGEVDMVNRMLIGQLQAALITSVGLAKIDNSVTALQTMPLVYRTLDEVDYVREKVRQKLERRLADKGFVVLFWTDAGWVKCFSRRPVLFPDDLKKQKLFVWAGESKSLEIITAVGFQAVPLETADIVIGLKNRLIDAIPLPPFFALAGQIYDTAQNMLDLNWAPLSGACVVSRKVWDKLPSETQAALRESAEKAGNDIRAQARKEMTESVAAMQKRGLTVYTLTPEAEIEWRKLAASTYPKIRGGLVPAEMFDEVMQLLAEYRAVKTP